MGIYNLVTAAYLDCVMLRRVRPREDGYWFNGTELVAREYPSSG